MDTNPQSSKDKILVQMNFPAPPINEQQLERFLSGKLQGPHDEHVVEWLESFLGTPRTAFTSQILERFREIVTKETFMSIVPAIEKLLKPLSDSCRAYCFGLYSASIALSGLASESLQILVWLMHEMEINGSKITHDQEKVVFGGKFERLHHERRINLLWSTGLITPDQKEAFHTIRETRNRYLHTWNENFSQEQTDALQCYKYVLNLFKDITGVQLRDASSVKANPLLTKWMNENLKF